MKKSTFVQLLVCLALILPLAVGCGAAGGKTSDVLYPIIENEKWGYINRQGEVVAPATFERAWRFHEGRGPVMVGGKYGFVDATGAIVIEPSYDFAGDFYDGLAAVKIGEKWGYIDPTGKLVIPATFDGASDFSEGFSAVQAGDVAYYIDKTGKKAMELPEDVRQFGRFSEGLAGVWIGETNGWGYIDTQGNVVIPPQFYAGEAFSEEVASVLDEKNERGFIDKNGNMVIEGLQRSSSFSEGLNLFQDATTQLNGYMDHSGKTVIAPQYEMGGAADFSEGLAAVKVDGKWGFIDPTGKQVIPAQYDLVESFEDGLAMVIQDGKPMYIDPEGQQVWPVSGE